MAGFGYKQRADKGFDFFDPNGKKITIEQYTQGTGANGSNLRQNLAQQGDIQSQNLIRQNNLAQISANAAKARANVYNPIAIGGDILGAAGKVAGGVGNFAKSTITGTADTFNKLGNAYGNTIAELNGTNAGVQQRNQQSQRDTTNTITKLTQQMAQQTDPVAKQRYATAISRINDVGNQQNTQTQQYFKQNADATDPRKVLTSSAELGLDALTAGRGKAVVGGGLNLAKSNVTKDALKQLLGGAAKGGAKGAGIGAAYSANETAKDPNATLGDYAKNTAQGALLGGALGTGGELVSPIIGRTLQKGVSGAKTVAKTVTEADPRVASLNEAIKSNQIAYDKETNPTRKAQINQGIAQLNAQRRNVLQNGSIRVPGGKETQQGVPTEQSAKIQAKSPETLPVEQVKPVSLQENISQPQVSTKDYLAQQAKAQSIARRGDGNGVGSKTKTEFRSKVIDSLSPIEDRLAQANKNGANIKISDANHITPQLDRVLRADTIGGQYASDNGLHKIIQNVPNTKEFDQYLIAKHASDLRKNGIETGRNESSDAQLVKDLAPKYEEHAKAISQYNQKLLDTATNYGLISKELATSLKKQYPNYVPANRIFGEGENQGFKGAGGGKASRSTQTVVQKIKGSKRQIESPLASIINKTQDVIKQGETNKAASILASYKDLEGNPFQLRELGKSETVGTKPVISYLDKGKVRRFETTQDVADAAKSLNKEQIGILGKIVRIPTRILRLGATGVNAGFALANIAKDMASAAVNSEHPLRSSVLNPKVAGKAISAAVDHGSGDYKELLREGAGGTSFDIARDQPTQNVAKIRAGKNVGTKALYTVKHPGELLRAVENTIGRSEEFTRALQYFGNKEAGLKQGLTEAESKRYGAHAARNNTINFARAGDYGAVLNSALPYLNAGIQGSRTLLRNVKNRPAQTLTKIAVLGILPTTTITAWNLSDEKRKEAYNDINDYEKQGNLIIVPPNPVKDPKTGRWNVIKIPVSQELANLNNIARNTVEQAHGEKDAVSMQKILGDLIGTTTSLQAQDPRQAIGQFVPQALKPAVETIQNKNLFTGNDIVPDSQKNLPNQDQYGKYTSNTAIALGKLTGQSPRIIDNAIKTATGGAGQTAVNTSDKILSATGLQNTNPVQGKSIGSSVADRFLGASSIPSSDKADKAYKDARGKLIADPAYKVLSQEDQAKALNRLQTDVNAVVYNAEDQANPGNGYTAKKLTANQSMLANGTKSLSDYTKPSVTALSGTKLSQDDPSYSFLTDLSGVDTAGKQDYLAKQVDPKYQSLIDNVNNALPQGYPKLPNTNAVAQVYADFAKAKADGNWSTLQTQKESQSAVKKAYQTELSPNQKFISTLSDSDIYDAVNNGQLDKADLDSVISLDNTFQQLGFSQNIGNKLRSALGYNTIKAKSSSLGKKRSFKIPTSRTFDRIKNTGDIYKILKSAKVS